MPRWQGLGGTAAQCQTLYGPGPLAGTFSNTVTVNGMTEPVLTMAANRWYRWRMVYAAVEGIMTPAISTCEVGLIAKVCRIRALEPCAPARAPRCGALAL